MFDLLVERSAGGGPWMARWVGGAGCCWIDDDHATLVRRAAAEAGRYTEWRRAWQPGFGPPAGAVRILEEVRTAGGPVGVSGSPMALFARDYAPVAISHVIEAFDVADRAWADIACRIARLGPAQRSTAPSAGRRSIEETLEHLGNCFWWYCSRIDDGLPDWPDAGLSFEERAGAFLRGARAWCIEGAGVGGPAASGTKAVVPMRYPTDDPAERWTFAKTIRRQAEHLWEHLGTVERDVEAF